MGLFAGRTHPRRSLAPRACPPGERYYESIDLADASHPQTILVHEMNGETLPVAHGAPLRMRLGRQLGCKMAIRDAS